MLFCKFTPATPKTAKFPEGRHVFGMAVFTVFGGLRLVYERE
jgi:hypothetical protein